MRHKVVMRKAVLRVTVVMRVQKVREVVRKSRVALPELVLFIQYMLGFHIILGTYTCSSYA